MEKYLDDEPLTEATCRGLRKGTLAFSFVPVLCGSAFKNKGVQPMLDAVIDYLPSPLDIPPTQGTDLSRREIVERKPSEDEPFAALAFKIVGDPFGKLTYFRVYSGQISKGDELYNSVKEKRERVGRLLLMHANNREDIDTAFAGDIVAGLGFKDVTTGDTLCDRNQPIILERMEFPEPVIHVAVEPKTKNDQDKLGKALKSLSDEDPTFRVRTDHDTGQTIISGMGELHLEILVDRMQREFNVDATVGKPQVAYRETITKTVESVEYRHIKQTGGPASSPSSRSRSSPRAPAAATSSSTRSPAAASRASTSRPSTRASSRRSASGVLAGYPTVDVARQARRRSVPRRRLQRDGVQDRRSAGLQEGRRDGPPVLLEPIMAVEVVTPEDYMGDVMGDLSSRRGRIEGMEAVGSVQNVRSQVPLSEMFGYSTDLRSRTQGRATYTMQFHSYQQVPESHRQRYHQASAWRVTPATTFLSLFFDNPRHFSGGSSQP